MKKSLLYLALMLITTAGLAESQEIISAMSSAIKQREAIEIEFTLNAKDASGSEIANTTGSVFAQGELFKMVNREAEIYCNGKWKWMLTTSTSELVIFPHDTTVNDLLENPTGFLTSLQKRNSGYNISPKTAKSTIRGKEATTVELTPTSKRAPYKSLKVSVDNLTKLPLRLTYSSKDGSSYTIDITSAKPTGAKPADFFEFPSSRLRGLTVTDLR